MLAPAAAAKNALLVKPVAALRGGKTHFGCTFGSPPGRARRRNDFQLTAARWRDLHLPVDAGGRAYDALRLRELVTQRLGAATPDRGRIAFDIRWACSWLPGRPVRRLGEPP